MRRCLIFLFLCLRLVGVYGQQKPAISENPAPIGYDSLQLMKGLEKIFEEEDLQGSYFFLNIGAGNNLYNLNNNYLNASQNQGPLIAYNPSLTYYHKSGFNLSLGSTLLRQKPGGFGRTQYSLAAAYDWEKTEKFAAGLALTKYFVKDFYSPYSSPIQNDAYAYFRYEKPFIEPGMTLGYSTGTYKTARIKDTVINGLPRRFYDSVSNRLKTFSASITAEHTFKFKRLLTASDNAEFTPSLMLNMSSSSTNISRKSNFPVFNTPAGKRRLNRLISNDFRVESLGLDLDLTYTLGNLVIEPDLYTDYYLQQTTESRWSFLFTLNVGYIF
jgi:hypothetical protein